MFFCLWFRRWSAGGEQFKAHRLAALFAGGKDLIAAKTIVVAAAMRRVHNTVNAGLRRAFAGFITVAANSGSHSQLQVAGGTS